jgi:hypothetical protein
MQMKNTTAEKRQQGLDGYIVVGVDPHNERPATVVINQDFTT